MDDSTARFRAQELADWPPSAVEELHGWRLRSTPGVLRFRSDSALPPASGGLDHLDEALTLLALRGGRQAVQVHEGQDALDAALAARGWEAGEPADVMTVPSAELVGPSPDVVSGPLDEAWLQVHRDVEQRTDVDATVREVFRPLGARARFLQVPGQAVALAVDSSSFVGVYCVATRPEARGQGLATQLLRAAAFPGREVYLQVFASNPAKQLYERLGFRRVDGYHYRVLSS